MNMFQGINQLRSSKILRYVLAGTIFLFNIYAMIELFFNNSEWFGGIRRLRMFTNLSNLIIFVVVLLYLLGKNHSKIYKYISVIGLVNILMTGIIYHALLASGNMDFNDHVVHTLNPIFYPIFYFLLVSPSIRFRDFWVTLIFPILYFGIILLIGPWTNWYPYGFMNPTLEGSSLGSVLIFCLGVLLPVISVFTVILIGLKVLLEAQLNKLK